MVRQVTQRALLRLAAVLALLGKLKLLLQQQQQNHKPHTQSWLALSSENDIYCQRWRLALESNNASPFRTVPHWCYNHVRTYMIGGEYHHDLDRIRDRILEYAFEISLGGDAMDAWVLDVDDTCISNINFYGANRFGCDQFDSGKFKEWIMKGECPAIPAILVLFKKLVERGFKVFLVTGRYEETLATITTRNLHNQGFIGYERLFLRSGEYKGVSAVKYKSEIRKQIEEEGYRIWGIVGDQWSDLKGQCLGKRTFKLPNPMYFIP